MIGLLSCVQWGIQEKSHHYCILHLSYHLVPLLVIVTPSLLPLLSTRKKVHCYKLMLTNRATLSATVLGCGVWALVVGCGVGLWFGAVVCRIRRQDVTMSKRMMAAKRRPSRKTRPECWLCGEVVGVRRFSWVG